MELFFNQPASCWLEGFPIGNGRIGAVIYGRTDQEILQINEDTIWAGSPCSEQRGMNPDTLKKAFLEAQQEKYYSATKYLEHSLQTAEDVQPYLPFGNLHLTFLSEGEISDYSRTLDLEQAAVFISYRRNGIKFSHTCFASAPAQGIIYRIQAEQPFSLKLHAEGEFLIHQEYTSHGFTLTGQCPGRSGLKITEETHIKDFQYPNDPLLRGIRYIGMGQILSDSTQTTILNDGVLLQNTYFVEIHFAVRTSFTGWNRSASEQLCDTKIHEKLFSDLSNMNLPFQELLTAHISDYRSFYDRTSFQLGSKEHQIRKNTYTLKDRLKYFEQGQEDPELYSLLFAFGKYLMISCSRPGTQPATLQGIWNNDALPPWFCDYTVNINTEMNYWMTGPLNLPEMLEPLIQMNLELLENGSKAAAQLLDAQGSACFHNTDIWRKASPATGMAVWAFWPFGAAWMCRNLYDEYLFRPNLKYLQKIFPILRANAQFCLSMLHETKDGLAICPATSPENLFFAPDSVESSVSVALYSENTLAITRNLFRDYLEACSELSFHDDLYDQISQILPQIVSPKIGSHGQILEWNKEFKEADIHHRHLSHLYELHPGTGISKDSPELFEAAKTSLAIRGEEGTGWSLIWKVLMWARTEDSIHASKILRNFFHVVAPDAAPNMNQGGIYPNLFCAHPPFQIDGNLGYCAAVAELLIQSHKKELVLLPALPQEWTEGEIRGFSARGGIRVDLCWSPNKVQFSLLSSRDRTIALRIGKTYCSTIQLSANVPYHQMLILN